MQPIRIYFSKRFVNINKQHYLPPQSSISPWKHLCVSGTTPILYVYLVSIFILKCCKREIRLNIITGNQAINKIPRLHMLKMRYSWRQWVRQLLEYIGKFHNKNTMHYVNRLHHVFCKRYVMYCKHLFCGIAVRVQKVQ